MCLDWNSTTCHQYRICLHSTLIAEALSRVQMSNSSEQRLLLSLIASIVHTASLKSAFSGFNKRRTKPQRTTWFHSSSLQSHIFNFWGIFKSTLGHVNYPFQSYWLSAVASSSGTAAEIERENGWKKKTEAPLLSCVIVISWLNKRLNCSKIYFLVNIF